MIKIIPRALYKLLISSQVFDFSGGQMTSQKISELKASFNAEFFQIYQLCELILDNSQRPTLLLVTLQTLLRFLNWIPLGYIFSTRMVEMLIKKVNFRLISFELFF